MIKAPKLTKLRDIRRRGVNEVIRPAGPWSPTVHRFLDYLHQMGFGKAPVFLRMENDAEEIVSFVKGAVLSDLMDKKVSSEDAIVSAAKLLRELHDASVGFLPKRNGDEEWMLPIRYPAEVICHGDFAPYNVTFTGNMVTGVFDFDTAHPGPRIWDVAYALYRWAPFYADNKSSPFTLSQKLHRARLFCQIYGLDIDDPAKMPLQMILRLTSLVEFMQAQADLSNSQFISDIKRGHLDEYQRDIEFIRNRSGEIASALMR